MFFLLDPVLEFNPLYDFRQAKCAVEFAPFLLCRHHQPKSHSQGGLAAEAAFGLFGPVSYGGKSALDGVAGPDVFPMFGGEIVERVSDLLCIVKRGAIMGHRSGCILQL